MVDVFISYSRSDEAQVRILSDAVKRLGYAVWWDDELPPHLSYGDVITDKIDKARAAIVVWSAEAAASEWVRAEADVARNQKKLIQTSLDGRMPPMPFNQIQFAEIGGWRGEDDHPGWNKVKASLTALCGPPTGATRPGPAPAPPPQPVTAPPKAARSPLVPALLGALALAAAVVLFLIARGGGPAPGGAANEAAAAAPTNQATDALPVRTDARFSQAATIEAAAGSAELRSGPSPEAFLVGRVSRGDVVTTYPQTGDWWQIRAADGTVGYVPRAAVHVMALGAVAARPVVHPVRPQPAPPVAAPAPAPVSAPAPVRAPVVAAVVPPLRPRVIAPNLHGNPGFPPGVINPRRYCKGRGRGTPPCRGMPEN